MPTCHAPTSCPGFLKTVFISNTLKPQRLKLPNFSCMACEGDDDEVGIVCVLTSLVWLVFMCAWVLVTLRYTRRRRALSKNVLFSKPNISQLGSQ